MRHFGQIGMVLLMALLAGGIMLWKHHEFKSNTSSQSKDQEVVKEGATASKTTHQEKVHGAVTIDIHMLEARHDGKRWELWADRSERYKGGKDFYLEGIRVNFPSDQTFAFKVKGNKGVINLGTMDMNIYGNVVVRSTNGDTFKTQTLFYSSKLRHLKGETPVEMRFQYSPERGSKGPLLLDKDVSLVGSKILIDLDPSQTEIYGSVVLKGTLKKEGIFTIRSEKVIFDNKSAVTQFLGDVQIHVGTIKVLAPQAQFQYKKETGAIVNFVVKGGVNMEGEVSVKSQNLSQGSELMKKNSTKKSPTQSWRARTKEVFIDLENEVFVLKGSPRVVQGEGELRGEEIIFRRGGDAIQIRKVRAKIDKDFGKDLGKAFDKSLGKGVGKELGEDSGKEPKETSAP